MYSENSGNANATLYAKDNLISRYKIAGTNTRYVDYYYDELNRLVDKELNLNDNKVILSTYSYYNSDLGGKYTTTQLKSEALDNIKYTYYYDIVGNMTRVRTSDALDDVTIDGNYRNYEYDDKNQLTRENNNSSKETVVYTYDGLGNISTKTKYAYTTSDSLGTAKETITYNYGKDSNAGWNHILTSVDLDGDFEISENEKIKYDAIGNPTTYLGASLSWNGRELTAYKNNTTDVKYTYDSDGLRSTKTVNGTKSTYYYVSGLLRYEERGTKKLYYFYDASGNLSAIRYYPDGGTTFYMYYILTNSRGDVEGIYSGSGVLLASYEYDAWGNCKITKDTNGIGELNPIRYRGYYYDSETKLYYLQSRYYNPQVGRFLNADGYVTTGQGATSYNMFAYCGNNPVMRSDPSGEFGIVAALALVAGVLAVTAFDHYLAKRYPDVVVSDSAIDRSGESKFGFYNEGKLGYAKGSGAKADENGATLFDTEVGLYSSTTKFSDGSQFDLAKLCTAKAVAEIDYSFNCSGEIGGYAALYATEFSKPFSLGNISIELSGAMYYGSISGGFEWDSNEHSVSVTSPTIGMGCKLGVDFDWNS